MKNQFHILGLNDNPRLRRRLLQPLERLQKLISISGVAVVMERRREETPAFRAYASLAVPGPDIHAEAHDYTMLAAWLKVTTALRKQIERRKNRPKTRLKNDRQLVAPGGFSGLAMART